MRLTDGDYVIRFVSLPHDVQGFTTYDEEARANIYINSEISEREQRKAISHELKHVLKSDAFTEESIRIIEGGCW